jgi:hypothetical protein
MLFELQHEISETIQAHCNAGARFDQWRAGGGWLHEQRCKCVGDLAQLLNCPASALEPFIVPEMVDEPTKRTIVLDVLRNVANYARRELAKQSRATTGRTRS